MRGIFVQVAKAGFPLEDRLRNGNIPFMAKGMLYVVVVAGGLKVRTLNTTWAQGQHVEIDPAFLEVCDELRQHIKSKLLVLVSPHSNSEFRQGGPTGVVPSGDEIVALRRAAKARERVPVVVHNINLDRDQVIRDHLSGKIDIKALAKKVAAEMGGRVSGEMDDETIRKIAEKLASMMPAETGPNTDESQIASKVVEMLLPVIQAAGGVATPLRPDVIEVDVGSVLPDRSETPLEAHIGEGFGKTSTGDGIEDQIADIEKILKEGQKESQKGGQDA